jgi:phosphoglycerol transferase MdoB-like AlkP superfamily enzyme
MSLSSFVRAFTHVESAVFAALLVVWLAELDETAKFLLGLTHGIGFLCLVAVIYVACLRGALAWPVLAAAVLLTPFGSSLAIEWGRHRHRHRGAPARG